MQRKLFIPQLFRVFDACQCFMVSLTESVFITEKCTDRYLWVWHIWLWLRHTQCTVFAVRACEMQVSVNSRCVRRSSYNAKNLAPSIDYRGMNNRFWTRPSVSRSKSINWCFFLPLSWTQWPVENFNAGEHWLTNQTWSKRKCFR